MVGVPIYIVFKIMLTTSESDWKENIENGVPDDQYT